MSDKRKARKRGGDSKEEEDAKPQLDKGKKAVCTWIRKNVPVKKTKFYNDTVEYFNSAKAIDMLIKESPWAKDKAKEGSEIVLDTRYEAISLMAEMMRCSMFHRAKKIPVAEKEKKKKNEDDTKKEKEKEKEKEREKKKRKIRLEMHQDQVIVDGNEAYVWLYDPKPWYYYVAGTSIVLGIIAVCLFPLWPLEMRQGVYYLSVGAAGFLVCFICLAIFKYILFVVLFLCTGFKLKFWIFPNLTEDVGVIESFKPAYVYTYDAPKKEKLSDDEESESESEDEDDNSKKDDVAADGDGEGSETGKDDKEDPDTGGSVSRADNGSDSGGSSKEFEIINGQDSS